MPDLKEAAQSAEADAHDHDELATTLGKLERWDEAIKEYILGVEHDLRSQRATQIVSNLLHALICAERPDQLFQFLETIKAKGWLPPSEGSSSDIHCTAFHAYVAIALHQSGKDASAEEQAMRRFTSKPDFKIVGWSWDELETWLKKTKLGPTARRPSSRSSPSFGVKRRHKRYNVRSRQQPTPTAPNRMITHPYLTLSRGTTATKED